MQVSFLQHFLVLLPDSLTGFQPCSFCHVNDEITFITAKEILNFWRKKEKEQGLWKHLPRHHPHTNQTPTNHPPTHSSTFPPPTYQSPTYPPPPTYHPWPTYLSPTYPPPPIHPLSLHPPTNHPPPTYPPPPITHIPFHPPTNHPHTHSSIHPRNFGRWFPTPIQNSFSEILSWRRM